jgi:shikimate dehydrogenase
VAGLGIIDGRTRFTAIFGDPVEHSRSPAMHNAAYAALGLNRAYLGFLVAPDRLRDALQAVRTLGFLGVNLTVPHKEAAVALMDALSDEARTLGAVNCVANHDGKLFGDNTDARGLESDLAEAKIDLADQSVIVIGAGGAAAAAIIAASRLRASRIILCNRTVDRAVHLATRLRGACRGTAIDTYGLGALTDGSLLHSATMMINSTPAGIKAVEPLPIAYEATSAHCLFYDLVYSRELTPFLAPAAAIGRRVLDGAGMLIGQGELAFELFNGLPPPEGIMRKALMEALGH